VRPTVVLAGVSSTWKADAMSVGAARAGGVGVNPSVFMHMVRRWGMDGLASSPPARFLRAALRTGDNNGER
jgi:hypothetical protein